MDKPTLVDLRTGTKFQLGNLIEEKTIEADADGTKYTLLTFEYGYKLRIATKELYD